MSFAFSECHEAVKALPKLSPEYLYRAAAGRMPSWTAGGAGLSLGSAMEALRLDGQPDEKSCPYISAEPVEVPPLLPTLPLSACHRATSVADHMNLKAVLKSLQSGRPVGLLVRITDTFVNANSDIVAYSDLLPSSENHCVVAAGCGTHVNSGEQYVLVRNSWGAGWGNNGSAWLPAKYVENHGVAYFEVQ